MKKLPLGNTGYEVSAMCLGTMRFGTRDDRETAYEILDAYAERGGSFLDTANIYAHWEASGRGGESETLLGEWMAERGNREEMFVATKVGFGYPGVGGGLRAEQITAECEKSLRRLGTDHIDLYYAHTDDPATPLREGMGAFNKLLEQGKILSVGASNYPSWRLAEANCVCRQNNWHGYSCLQQRYTYLRPRVDADFSPQRTVTPGVLDYCRERKVTLLAYSPLLGGAYVRGDKPIPPQYRHADTDARLRVLGEMAETSGLTVNQLVLAWMLNSRPPVIPVFSASTRRQLDEDLAALDVALTDEQRDRLDSVTA